jgi:hypothetical protein
MNRGADNRENGAGHVHVPDRRKQVRVRFLYCLGAGLLLAYLALLPIATIAAELDPGEGIPWWTLDSGGGESRGGAYTLRGEVGQPEAQAVAAMGGDYSLRGGVWHPPAIVMRSIWLPLTVNQPAPP